MELNKNDNRMVESSRMVNAMANNKLLLEIGNDKMMMRKMLPPKAAKARECTKYVYVEHVLFPSLTHSENRLRPFLVLARIIVLLALK